MGLAFTEKVNLNRAILSALRLKLLDKEQSVLPPEGKLYNHLDPANQSILWFHSSRTRLEF